MKVHPKLDKWIKKNFPETKRKEPKKIKEMKGEDFLWIIITFLIFNLGTIILDSLSPSKLSYFLVTIPLAIFIVTILNLKIGFIIIKRRRNEKEYQRMLLSKVQ